MNEEQQLAIARIVIDDAHDLLENEEVKAAIEVLRLFLNHDPEDYATVYVWMNYLKGLSTDEAKELIHQIVTGDPNDTRSR